MNIYIWESVNQCTSNYHSGGAVVVFADTEEEARAIANDGQYCKIELDEKPSYIRECSGLERKVFIFQDAGCC